MALELFSRLTGRNRAGPLSLLVLCCLAGGLAGGLLDIDHVQEILGWHPPVLFALGGPHGIREGRFLHGVALVVGGIGSVCVGGYLYWMVLKGIMSSIRARLQERNVEKNVK